RSGSAGSVRLVLWRLHDFLDPDANGSLQGRLSRRGPDEYLFDVFTERHPAIPALVLFRQVTLGCNRSLLGPLTDEVREERKDPDDDHAWSGGHARAAGPGAGVLHGPERNEGAGRVRGLSAREPWVYRTASSDGSRPAICEVFREVPEHAGGH